MWQSTRQPPRNDRSFGVCPKIWALRLQNIHWLAMFQSVAIEMPWIAVFVPGISGQTQMRNSIVTLPSFFGQERVLDFLFVDFESMWGNSADGSSRFLTQKRTTSWQRQWWSWWRIIDLNLFLDLFLVYPIMVMLAGHVWLGDLLSCTIFYPECLE